MEAKENLVNLKAVVDSQGLMESAPTVTVYRFDLFKGVKDATGKVVKVKTVGSAYIREGLKTYTVHLKTLLKDTFYRRCCMNCAASILRE